MRMPAGIPKKLLNDYGDLIKAGSKSFKVFASPGDGAYVETSQKGRNFPSLDPHMLDVNPAPPSSRLRPTLIKG